MQAGRVWAARPTSACAASYHAGNCGSPQVFAGIAAARIAPPIAAVTTQASRLAG